MLTLINVQISTNHGILLKYSMKHTTGQSLFSYPLATICQLFSTKIICLLSFVPPMLCAIYGGFLSMYIGDIFAGDHLVLTRNFSFSFL